ncbi:MAG TPA: hypothetical protein VFG10_05420 [Saprospiraceae bacterium]|nr:hypothetical protein [Saprospiraceae bacterium]
MQFPFSFLFLLFLLVECKRSSSDLNCSFAQSNKYLYFIKSLPTDPYTLAFEKDSSCTDTLMIFYGYENLLDFVVKSENEIAILLKGVDTYSYYQLQKSEIYQLWTTDSVAIWSGPRWDYKNPDNPEFKAKYKLKDFYTVIKILDADTLVINLQTQKSEHAQPPMHERELQYVIQSLSEDPKKDWKAIDSIFRNQVMPTPSNTLRHLAFLKLIIEKDFLENADTATLNFYAKELEKMEFREDIKFHIMLINKLSAYWPSHQLAEYVRNLYDRNTKYWEANFSSPYWEEKETELAELKRLMRKK